MEKTILLDKEKCHNLSFITLFICIGLPELCLNHILLPYLLIGVLPIIQPVSLRRPSRSLQAEASPLLQTSTI